MEQWGSGDPVAEVSRDGAAAVVRLGGELDLANANRVRSALLDVAAEDVDRVIVDLSGVTFLDSTALGVLVEVRRTLAPRRLLLAGPAGEARRALEVTGLARHLGIYDTVSDAVHAEL